MGRPGTSIRSAKMSHPTQLRPVGRPSHCPTTPSAQQFVARVVVLSLASETRAVGLGEDVDLDHLRARLLIRQTSGGDAGAGCTSQRAGFAWYGRCSRCGGIAHSDPPQRNRRHSRRIANPRSLTRLRPWSSLRPAWAGEFGPAGEQPGTVLSPSPTRAQSWVVVGSGRGLPRMSCYSTSITYLPKTGSRVVRKSTARWDRTSRLRPFRPKSAARAGLVMTSARRAGISNSRPAST